MKLAIVGSRLYNDYGFVRRKILTYFNDDLSTIDEIVSGGARGVDFLAERFANAFDKPIKVFRADWKGLGKSAGHIRNKQIVDYSDIIFAFPGRSSPGTMNTVHQAAVAMYNGGKQILRVYEVDC